MACSRRARDIRLRAPSGHRMSQRAAPENKPARGIYPWLSVRLPPGHRAANRRIVRGSRLFYTRFGRTSDETKVAWVARYVPKRHPSRHWALLISASFCVFWAIPSYPLRLILRTMGSFILIFFALLAAARGIADSPTPSGSLASLPDGLYAKITTPRGIIMGKRVQQ